MGAYSDARAKARGKDVKQMLWRVTAVIDGPEPFRAKTTIAAHYINQAVQLAQREFEDRYTWGGRDASGRLYRRPEVIAVRLHKPQGHFGPLPVR